MIKIPPQTQYIIETLNKNGFEAYIVGGSVRDMLLGLTPTDFDVTTSAKPEDVQSLFKKTIPTGIKHGTITVVVEGTPIEVTTFRKESDYTDNRHPEKIDFVTDIKEDLTRRDFTINALAYNNKTGIIDFYDGLKDLKNKLLRAVGNPKERFTEDALRILRLFRFASVLGFNIEKQTHDTAIECSNLLPNISRERILPELYKAFTGEFCNVLSPLIKSKSLAFLGVEKLPEFEKIKSLRKNQLLSFFAFLYFSSDNVLNTLAELKASNKLKDYCENMLKALSIPTPQTKSDIKRILNIVPLEVFKDYIIFKETTENCNLNLLNQYISEIIENREPYLISHLNISGEQIKNSGFSGKQIGLILNALLQTVIENPQKNNYEDLMNEIIEFSP